MAPKRAPKNPIPEHKRQGQPPRPGTPKVEQAKTPPPQPQHKPWSTSVKGGARGR